MLINGDTHNTTYIRRYFETGCKCILLYHTLTRVPDDVDDDTAAQFYLDHCTCSRNVINGELYASSS